MKLIILIFLTSISTLNYAEILEGGSTDYVGGKNVYVSNETLLRRTSTIGLSKKDMQLRKSAILLYENPHKPSFTKQYLLIFPATLDDFLSTFNNSKNEDINFNSAIYIDLLRQSALEHPAEGAEVLLGISKSACLKADLMNYLQNALIEFTVHNTDQYLAVNDKLTKEEKETLANFFVAKLYSNDPGLCKD